MTAAVDVQGLTVRFPRRAQPSLRRVDLRVAAGERVLVLGPSGSGKSTLLHTLAGIVPQSLHAGVTGRVRVGALDPAAVPVSELAATVGWLGQDPAAQVCLPAVDDEVALPLENRAVPRSQIAARVAGSLASVGAAHLLHRRASELSGGELQRVALAAVLAPHPEVVLLDEPTALLDPAAARAVGSLLADLPGRPAQLLIEHRLAELERLPERLVVLDGAGHVLVDGPTGPVLDRHGRLVAAAGCWLPLATEVALITGRPPAGGGAAPASAVLADPAATAALRDLARTGGSAPRAAGARRPVLVADRVSYSLGGRDVVRKVSLTLGAGEVTALLGANGAGKSTLLMGLAGLLEPSGGGVTGGPAGLVFQRPEHQFVARTVAGEVTSGLPGRGRRRQSTAAVAPQVTETMRRFGLSALAEADPFRLSGGQQRRLSVAAMTVLGHPVLLLDEPTFGLDRVHSEVVADLLSELAAAGTAVAFATHDLRLAAAVADRVAVLADGSLLASGPAETVLRDGGALAEAGLLRPELLRWWAGEPEVPLRPLLRGLRRQLTDNAAGASLQAVSR